MTHCSVSSRTHSYTTESVTVRMRNERSVMNDTLQPSSGTTRFARNDTSFSVKRPCANSRNRFCIGIDPFQNLSARYVCARKQNVYLFVCVCLCVCVCVCSCVYACARALCASALEWMKEEPMGVCSYA